MVFKGVATVTLVGGGAFCWGDIGGNKLFSRDIEVDINHRILYHPHWFRDEVYRVILVKRKALKRKHTV